MLFRSSLLPVRPLDSIHPEGVLHLAKCHAGATLKSACKSPPPPRSPVGEQLPAFPLIRLAARTSIGRQTINLPGWCWAEIQQFALVGSSSSLHSEACNALGASDGVIHSRISLEVVSLRASTNKIRNTKSTAGTVSEGSQQTRRSPGSV